MLTVLLWTRTFHAKLSQDSDFRLITAHKKVSGKWSHNIIYGPEDQGSPSTEPGIVKHVVKGSCQGPGNAPSPSSCPQHSGHTMPGRAGEKLSLSQSSINNEHFKITLMILLLQCLWKLFSPLLYLLLKWPIIWQKCFLFSPGRGYSFGINSHTIVFEF